MASRLPLYLSLLLLVAAIVMYSEARDTPAGTESKERNGRAPLNEHYANPRTQNDRALPTEKEELIGIQDYGDARANHRHDPHHPLAVKGKEKELAG